VTTRRHLALAFALTTMALAAPGTAIAQTAPPRGQDDKSAASLQSQMPAGVQPRSAPPAS
jgi:hypothetical protein